MINKIEFINKEAYMIENNMLRIIVLSEGANIISIFHKESNEEILRTPESLESYNERPMICGTPVLIPPNRIEDAKFEFEGRMYHLKMNRAKENNHIHGFVNDKTWEIKHIDEEKSEIVFMLKSTSNEEIYEQMPHSFVLMMKISLNESEITQTLTVINESDENLPFGLGYHTTFHFLPGSTLTLHTDEKWELGDRGLPTGKLLKTNGFEKMDVTNKALDDIYVMTDKKEAMIKRNGLEIIYEADDNFKQWVLFTAKGDQGLLAIEPYTWVTNAPNLDLPWDKTGMDFIEPKKDKNFTTKIRLKNTN